MNQLNIPVALQSVIGQTKVDFIVQARRNQPVKRSMVMIFFGLFWTAFTSIFVFSFLGPIFRGEEAHFTSNGVAKTGSLENFGPMLTPTLILGLFVLVGIGMLAKGIYSLLQKGGYYVGTSDQLIRYRKGNITKYEWEQFTGSMEINNLKGDISLQLRTGKMVRRKNNSEVYVPDIIYISGVADVLEVEKRCRRRF